MVAAARNVASGAASEAASETASEAATGDASEVAVVSAAGVSASTVCAPYPKNDRPTKTEAAPNLNFLML